MYAIVCNKSCQWQVLCIAMNAENLPLAASHGAYFAQFYIQFHRRAFAK